MKALDEGLIKVTMERPTREGAVEELVDLMVAKGVVKDRDALLADLRSAPPSAVPHVRSESVTEAVCAVGRGCGDCAGELVFVTVSPARETVPFVRMLGRIARLMKDSARCAALLSARDASAMLGLVGDLA